MEDLVALIAAIFEALQKRGRTSRASPSMLADGSQPRSPGQLPAGRRPIGAPGSSGGSISALLRDAFSSRAPGANAQAGGTPIGAGRAAVEPPQIEANSPYTEPAASGFLAGRVASAGSTAESASVGRAAKREAGLVTALFASPQSLVAAFVVAEVLAPPVAMRER
jgi:hypothetical protein